MEFGTDNQNVNKTAFDNIDPNDVSSLSDLLKYLKMINIDRSGLIGAGMKSMQSAVDEMFNGMNIGRRFSFALPSKLAIAYRNSNNLKFGTFQLKSTTMTTMDSYPTTSAMLVSIQQNSNDVISSASSFTSLLSLIIIVTLG